ncbi:hypothetical protein QN277_008950 [Acacia crassicarpa]|uniref:Uncharacterized protein n=1 Tax=Acacia crassicarpa TaxID=499986 RepID=A0AAE1MDN2_9FABA|nr:hypothetical protein QN277_008950 [Acacia crassicarpa]
MATSFAPISISGGCHLKPRELWLNNPNSLRVSPKLAAQRKSKLLRRNRNSTIRAEYRDNGSGGGDFVAGFLLGGAIFGTLAFTFAPQIRRSLLNEDEHGFRKARRPIYYDEGLEWTLALNEKIGQLNSAIDNVSSRLRGGNKAPAMPVENDPEVEATL